MPKSLCSERKPSQSCEGFFCSEAGGRYVHAMSALCNGTATSPRVDGQVDRTQTLRVAMKHVSAG